MTTPRRAPEVLLRRYWDDPDTPVVTAGLSALSLGYRGALRVRGPGLPLQDPAHRAAAVRGGLGRQSHPGRQRQDPDGRAGGAHAARAGRGARGGEPGLRTGHARRADRGGPRRRADRRAHRRRRAAAARRAAARRRGGGGRKSQRGRTRRGRASRGDRARARRRLPAPDAREGPGGPRGAGSRSVGQCPRLSPRHAPRAARRTGPGARDRGDQSAGPRGGGGGDRDGAALQSRRASRSRPATTIEDAIETKSGRRVPVAELAGRRLLAFAGLGSPQGFADTLDAAGIRRVAFAEFPDHHWFTPGDLRELVAGRAGGREPRA